MNIVLQEGFERAYVSSNRKPQVDSFVAFLNGQRARFSNYFLAPYTVVVQSSGYGKTRLIKEVSEKIYVVYVCFRSKDSSGYYPRSDIADELELAEWKEIKNDKQLEMYATYCAFLVAAMEQAGEAAKRKEATRQFFEKQVDTEESEVFWEEVRAKMDKFKSELYDEAKNLCNNRSSKRRTTDSGTNSKDSTRRKTAINDIILDLAKKRVENTEIRIRKHFSSLGIQLLFAFDEARALVNSKIHNPSNQGFRCLRYALAAIEHDETIKAFAVFLDTSGKISNFQEPSVEIRSSSERFIKHKSNLLAPFYRLLNFDIMGRESTGDEVYDKMNKITPESATLHPYVSKYSKSIFSNLIRSDRSSSKKTAESSLRKYHFRYFCELARKGRPLWRTTIEFPSGANPTKDHFDRTAKSLGQFAFQKLMKRHDSSMETIPQSGWEQEDALAVICPRVDLFVTPNSELSEHLVADRMATLMYISEDRKNLFLQYPSEPVLVEGSIMAMRNKDFRLFCVRTIIDLSKKGMVLAGVRGEIVARILIIFAWDKATAGLPIQSVPISVERFLGAFIKWEKFTGAFGKFDGPKNALTKFSKGAIFCTHFTSVNYAVKRDMLWSFFYRGAAITCKRNQRAIDLIIPVLLEGGCMSFILIQVKNYASSPGTPVQDSTSMTPGNCGIDEEEDVKYPYLTLYMSLRGYKKPAIKSLLDEPGYIFSLNYLMLINSKSKSQDSRISAGLYMIDPEVYPFLEDQKNLVGALNELLVDWLDPVMLESDIEGKLDTMDMNPMAYGKSLDALNKCINDEEMDMDSS